MSIKPILFNTEMVRALLDGRKTVTRRLVKLPKSIERSLEFREDGSIWWQSTGDGYGDGGRFADLGECAKYFNLYPCLPGDILYVRETWSTRKSNECHAQPCHTGICPYESCEFPGGPCFPDEYVYKATDSLPVYGGKWHPSIHMPRKAARIWLRVTDVRGERLFNSFFKPGAVIFDLRAEGITLPEVCVDCIDTYGWPCCNDEDCEGGSECGNLDDVRADFSTLWDSTIKPADRERYGWVVDPWVWVIGFERCEKPEED